MMIARRTLLRAGGSLVPVASFYISKTRGKPISATVD